MTDARHALNSGDPRQQAAVLQAVKSGDMGSLITATFTGLTSAAAQDVTSAEAFANVALTGWTPDADDIALPPVGTVVSCRVTAGTAGVLARYATDTAPTVTTVQVSADRTTVTFEAVVTAFILQYYAAPAGGMDQSLPGLGAP